MTSIGNTNHRVRAFVCDLYLKEIIHGPLWHVYETGGYDEDTDSVTIAGKTYKVTEK